MPAYRSSYEVADSQRLSGSVIPFGSTVGYREFPRVISLQNVQLGMLGHPSLNLSRNLLRFSKRLFGLRDHFKHNGTRIIQVNFSLHGHLYSGDSSSNRKFAFRVPDFAGANIKCYKKIQ
jgi:hypothetical protein